MDGVCGDYQWNIIESSNHSGGIVLVCLIIFSLKNIQLVVNCYEQFTYIIYKKYNFIHLGGHDGVQLYLFHMQVVSYVSTLTELFMLVKYNNTYLNASKGEYRFELYKYSLSDVIYGNENIIYGQI